MLLWLWVSTLFAIFEYAGKRPKACLTNHKGSVWDIINWSAMYASLYIDKSPCHFYIKQSGALLAYLTHKSNYIHHTYAYISLVCQYTRCGHVVYANKAFIVWWWTCVGWANLVTEWPINMMITSCQLSQSKWATSLTIICIYACFCLKWSVLQLDQIID